MKTLALATIAALALTGTAFAKAHNQGANGDDGRVPGEANTGGAKTTIELLEDLDILDGRGVSAIVKGGAQGAEKSDGRGGMSDE